MKDVVTSAVSSNNIGLSLSVKFSASSAKFLFCSDPS
nr:MAG TPA: hypothetical protein [Caudoviricetes sp.]